MGQSTSKNVGKAVGSFVNKTAAEVKAKVTQSHPPPPPPPPTGGKKTTTAANPAMFLRGEGAASQDIRDTMQEMYLQNSQKKGQKKEPQIVDKEGNDKSKSQEMPDDLLKFIQDVGPAKQSIDRQFTSPKLLEKDSENELNKAESARTSIRQRHIMPLMGQDTNFTTERNTNFSYGAADNPKDFGVSNLQWCKFLADKRNGGSVESAIKAYSDHIMTTQEGWTEQELEEQRNLLRTALDLIDLPILRRDDEYNIFGLHQKDVPGPEVKSVHMIPPNKARLVLDDLRDATNVEGNAQKKLELRRQQRKGVDLK